MLKDRCYTVLKRLRTIMCRGARMPKKEEEKKSKRAKVCYPERIDDSPENVARIILNTKPKPRGDWKYEKKQKED